MELTSGRAVAIILMKIGRSVIMLIPEVLPSVLIPTLLLPVPTCPPPFLSYLAHRPWCPSPLVAPTTHLVFKPCPETLHTYFNYVLKHFYILEMPHMYVLWRLQNG